MENYTKDSRNECSNECSPLMNARMNALPLKMRIDIMDYTRETVRFIAKIVFSELKLGFMKNLRQHKSEADCIME